MPFDPQDGFPDDWHVPPSAQGDGFPDDWHVPPSAEGDGFPDDWHVPPSAEGDGFPDDWHVPPSAEGDGFPNDWYVPPTAQGNGFPDDWHVQPGAAAYTRPNPPASDSFAAVLPFMPFSRAAMSTWGQPTMGDALAQPPLQQTWPSALPPPIGRRRPPRILREPTTSKEHAFALGQQPAGWRYGIPAQERRCICVQHVPRREAPAKI
jgi:hypothetical protein